MEPRLIMLRLLIVPVPLEEVCAFALVLALILVLAPLDDDVADDVTADVFAFNLATSRAMKSGGLPTNVKCRF